MSMMNCLYCSRIESYVGLLHTITEMICTVSLEESSISLDENCLPNSKIENISNLFMTSPCAADGNGSPSRPHSSLDDNAPIIEPVNWLMDNIGGPSSWLSNIIGRAKVSFGVVSTALLYLQKISANSDTTSSELTRTIYSGDFSNIIFQRRLYRIFILTLIMIASKYHQDKHYSNSVWAELSGFSLELINLMERVCLRLLYFDLYVEGDIIYYKNWLQYWIGYSKMLDNKGGLTQRHLQLTKSKKKKFTCLFSFKK